jgi:hypothetical protein
MSVNLIFPDDKSNTRPEKDFPHEGGAAALPGQGDLVRIPGGEQLRVKSRQFIYPDSEQGQRDVQVIFVCEDKGPAPMIVSKIKGL